MARIDSELRELSGHVLFEIQVLFGTAEALGYHATADNFGLPKWLTSIEAFVIHARALEHFVFQDRGARTRRDDGLAGRLL